MLASRRHHLLEPLHMARISPPTASHHLTAPREHDRRLGFLAIPARPTGEYRPATRSIVPRRRGRRCPPPGRRTRPTSLAAPPPTKTAIAPCRESRTAYLRADHLDRLPVHEGRRHLQPSPGMPRPPAATSPDYSGRPRTSPARLRPMHIPQPRPRHITPAAVRDVRREPRPVARHTAPSPATAPTASPASAASASHRRLASCPVTKPARAPHPRRTARAGARPVDVPW